VYTRIPFPSSTLAAFPDRATATACVSGAAKDPPSFGVAGAKEPTRATGCKMLRFVLSPFLVFNKASCGRGETDSYSADPAESAAAGCPLLPFRGCWPTPAPPHFLSLRTMTTGEKRRGEKGRWPPGCRRRSATATKASRRRRDR